MKNNFFYNFSLGNINAKPSNNSETLSQILYGEKFKVLKNQKNWVKIKTNFDNYIIIDASQEIDKISDIIFEEIKNV